MGILIIDCKDKRPYFTEYFQVIAFKWIAHRVAQSVIPGGLMILDKCGNLHF